MLDYIPIDKALELADVSLIKNQISLRIEAISNCVGWLYPSILNDEIEKLKNLIKNIYAAEDSKK